MTPSDKKGKSLADMGCVSNLEPHKFNSRIRTFGTQAHKLYWGLFGVLCEGNLLGRRTDQLNSLQVTFYGPYGQVLEAMAFNHSCQYSALIFGARFLSCLFMGFTGRLKASNIQPGSSLRYPNFLSFDRIVSVLTTRLNKLWWPFNG